MQTMHSITPRPELVMCAVTDRYLFLPESLICPLIGPIQSSCHGPSFPSRGVRQINAWVLRPVWLSKCQFGWRTLQATRAA